VVSDITHLGLVVTVPGSEQQEPINYDQQTEATEEGSLVDQEDRFTVKITKQGTERWLEFNCMAKSGVIEVDSDLGVHEQGPSKRCSLTSLAKRHKTSSWST
jgi:hypothetical protein